MKSADHGLRNVFPALRSRSMEAVSVIYSCPSALPYILAAARISSGLSVIGAVVCGIRCGLWRVACPRLMIVESGTLLNIPRMLRRS